MIKSYPSSFLQSLTVFLIVCCSSLVAEVSADVPASKRFSYNLEPNGFRQGYYETEYRVSFRDLPIQSYPFSLCFYEANPESTGVDESVPVTNSYILAIGMGHAHSDGITRWVWAANLNRPVGDKAKLVFSRSGNLALIDGNGRIGWQTRTSNKGVVDIRLLPNGNLVLLDRNGGYVWQSFHYPTNTLLVGQGLGPGSSTTNKIVNGRYSLVLQDAKLSLFIGPEAKSSKPTNIYNITQMSVLGSNITFDTSKRFFGPGPGGFYISLSIVVSTNSAYPLATPKYNSTLSMLRIGSNGNLFIYTYSELPVNGYMAWEKTYATFSGEQRENECILPSKCGSFGLCEDNQCVACPTPKGLLGWDKNCKLPSIPSCNASAANVGYYEVPGASDYRLQGNSDGEGPMRADECMKKCSNDCKCVGFFHRSDFTCLLATQINTLAKADFFRASADIYIKYTK
ncbi:hypothetical protein MKW98_017992 [Papaver atlanticum]|uniref:Bulb-type lectin domain-containing protein n=1 Tax=Papaver atlanticum TaxID=357466 RepID=A0AAD4TF65_9MAGN|nr:hypothetical protein MKW98_017992 [Papaver atlanticum]